MSWDRFITSYQMVSNRSWARLLWISIWLSVCCKEGCGCVIDTAEAFRWFKKAAFQNYSLGQFNLGYSCRDGVGVAMNKKKAYDLYKIAADKGEAIAMYNLCVLIFNGDKEL